jgi:hypothetical protein
MNILLDYFFPITAITPTPAASTAFLKQACVVGKPVSPDTGSFTLCTSSSAAQALVDSAAAKAEIAQLFAGGLTRCYVLTSPDLDIADAIEGHEADFFTILVTSDYSDADITAADFGEFTGVVSISSVDDAFLAVQAAIENRSAFHTTSGNKAKNMFYAFGKLLSNSVGWLNQQYITMPFADDVSTLGDANALFDDKVNFVISDDEFGNRLALLACGGKAIVAPYIVRNLEIDMQSKALQYISGNMPSYTHTQAALLEDELDKVLNGDAESSNPGYIGKGWIEAGTVSVKLEQDNFVASGYINIAEPKAMWRIFGEIRQTL